MAKHRMTLPIQFELPPGTTRRRLNELYEGNQAERQGKEKKEILILWKKKQASDDSEIDSATKNL